MDLIRQHPWPGNVRELENLMERLVILAEGEVIEVSDLPEKFQQLARSPLAKTREFSEGGLIFTDAVQAFERDLILRALHQTNWVKSRAAQLLHLNRTTLLEKMKKQNISASPDFAPQTESISKKSVS
jgi:DNA-binding NtrC family response regulator